MQLVPSSATILRQAAEPVAAAESDEIEAILLDMERFAEAHGDAAGLAAPQIGVSKRAFIFKRRNEWQWVINPTIVRSSPKTKTEVEGCLSLPNLKVAVERPLSVILSYYDDPELLGDVAVNESFGSPLSRVVQHEIDHLCGILITDRGETVAIRT